jgi:hypothetical protein
MDEPMLRAWIEDGGAPENRETAAGRFVGEMEWPSPQVMRLTLSVVESGLDRLMTSSVAQICSPCWTGAGAGEWMGTGAPSEAPADQRLDDGFSHCFDSGPLDAPLELLGAPEFDVELACDQPLAQICARLCDLSPDGASRRISYGVLNLTHRDSHEDPSALTPGEVYRVRIKLNDCGYRIAPGHRLRLAVSTAYWPLIWPAPARATLTLRLPATLTLPVRGAPFEEPAPGFAPRATAADAPKTMLGSGHVERKVEFDLGRNVSTYETVAAGGLFGEGAYRFDEIDSSVSHDLKRSFSIAGDDPLSARYRLEQNYEMGREGWRIRIETRLSLRATATHFLIEAELDAYENGALARARAFSQEIARDLL